MTNAPINLQDLRRRIYVKAKTEPTWHFWGLYVHVCKKETLQQAYEMAKSNDGAPGIDGVTFEAIEESGVESFLRLIQDELVNHMYQPMPVRKKEIPKDGGTKVRVLSIPAIRDRVAPLLRSVGWHLVTFTRTRYLWLPGQGTHQTVSRGSKKTLHLVMRSRRDRAKVLIQGGKRYVDEIMRRLQSTLKQAPFARFSVLSMRMDLVGLPKSKAKKGSRQRLMESRRLSWQR
jgi:hypothetical protein